MPIGSTDALGVEYLIHDDSAIQTLTDDDMIESDSEDKDEDQALNNLYDRATKGEIDLDAIMISAAHAGKSKGVDPAHLSKIWKIDLKTAERWTILYAERGVDWSAKDISWRTRAKGTARQWSEMLGFQLFSVRSSSC